MSKFKSEKKNKFRRCLFTLSIKRKIRHLHVIVVQKWQKNAKIKAWCTCKAVVLLIKPIVLLKSSLPSCRWILVVITWTRMLDGKANGCSQWFLSHRSVASGLEKPLVTGYIIYGLTLPFPAPLSDGLLFLFQSDMSLIPLLIHIIKRL